MPSEFLHPAHHRFSLKAVVDAMADAFLVLDGEGVVRVANRAACDLLARSEEQLLGSPIRTVTEMLAPPAAALDRLILGGCLREFESDLPLPRAETTSVSTSAFPIRDQAGRPVAFVCIVRNTTEQKRTQREMQHQSKRQTALYELLLAMSSTLERRAVVDLLLDKITDFVPETVATVMLQPDGGEAMIHSVSRGVDNTAWEREAAGGDPAAEHRAAASKDTVWIANIQAENDLPGAGFFRRNGFVSYLGVPLIAHDQLLGTLSFYSPRERVYRDDEIKFLKALAGQAAGAIYNARRFEQTRQKAGDFERSSRAKDEFMSVMSHELRTPLNIIAGYTKVVQDGLMGAINAEQMKALDKVTRHANEMLLMVNSIMAATKIEAGMVHIESDEFPLGELLDDLRLLYDYSFGVNVSLEWDYPPDLPVLRTDRDKLKHVLQNLVNNALKFTDQGVVKISARLMADMNGVELSVADTGIGIADEELPLIFDRFRQLDSSGARSHGGVGLGLHIVRTFTQLLGGTITVASQPGKGSTFTITLPCAHEKPAAGTTVISPRLDSAAKS